ncbi:MAG: hypothetical protein K2W96_23790, partial [Gemmataceae bacterium]|nr:hypothetical protein [Gemmataceae bacterium]
MTHRILGTGLLLAAFVAFPAADAFAQKDKKKEKPAEVAPPTDSDKLKASEFAGTLKTVPGTDRTFTMDVEHVTLVP